MPSSFVFHGFEQDLEFGVALPLDTPRACRGRSAEIRHRRMFVLVYMRSRENGSLDAGDKPGMAISNAARRSMSVVP